MDERDWLILKVLYEKKNITKTAQSLYISQPSLTKRIQQIENVFQVAIINRGTKGIQFTPQGEYLAKSAEDMLTNLQQMKEMVLNMEQDVRGTLRLGVSNYIARYKLPRLLKLFKDQFPNVNYKVTTGWSHDIVNMVYHRDVHIGIIRGDYQWADSKWLLFEENISVASKEPFTLDDLPDMPRINYETDSLLKTIIDQWWNRTFSQSPLIGMEVDKGITCKEMVINGLGYGILPSALIEEHPDLHSITLKDELGDPLIRKTWMFYHEDTTEINMVREFVQFVEKVNFNHVD
ncbi:LysR family transcriptional regulator [Alkalihalobacillus sp. MEB130]|uniref:LysR family transcriptional regulator n=1 Tax=Alkalihalobacillus sp. MEB130 TaxID=2976704 RepID=UPI0028DEA2DB|nr:LysR family transcriptional regulator [Alkalihalobacillus sp. MEB130]MDT8861288.1 LysR family transcriptional regulator [Alkalihalobacillus sp. MEB130]